MVAKNKIRFNTHLKYVQTNIDVRHT
ncbi:hypothetical protein BN1200_990021 [Klebsiella variicola]|nr:hypothetical protein BN1200_1770003 [Klebsiella variicola]CTQ24209.1 hypothetical protein BN1200_990021 [Klebsiella variicola]